MAEIRKGQIRLLEEQIRILEEKRTRLMEAGNRLVAENERLEGICNQQQELLAELSGMLEEITAAVPPNDEQL